MDWHPIQGEVEILLVASCHGNRDKLQPDGPLGSYADLFLLKSKISTLSYQLDNLCLVVSSQDSKNKQPCIPVF